MFYRTKYHTYNIWKDFLFHFAATENGGHENGERKTVDGQDSSSDNRQGEKLFISHNMSLEISLVHKIACSSNIRYSKLCLSQR